METVLLPSGDSVARRPIFDLESVYRSEFDFVWRNLKRLGVPPSSLDDAAQKVFLVVHRRLGELDGDARLRGWLFQIVRRVAHDERRALAAGRNGDERALETTSRERDRPDVAFELKAAAELLHEILGRLDEATRDAFILSDLEGFSAPEIAASTGTNLNTVYARIRTGREEVERRLARERARAQHQEGARKP